MHIASLEAHTTLNIYNLWKLALRGHLNTDAQTRDRTWNFFYQKNDAVTARPQVFWVERGGEGERGTERGRERDTKRDMEIEGGRGRKGERGDGRGFFFHSYS